jgi:CDP-diacylglycerol--glycerol-3-phosphate 3-phosphatidyltransferase
MVPAGDARTGRETLIPFGEVSRADDRAATFLKAITWLRVVLTPIVMALVLDQRDRADTLAAALFAVAAVTDFFDGRLARRWKQTTSLGAFLDTTADKLLVSGVLIALVAVGRASAWVGFLIVAREMLVFGLKGVASGAEGAVVTPSFLGKAKANLQFVAIFVAILRPDIVIDGRFLDEWLMWLAAAVTLWSGIDYVGRYAGVFSRVRGR